MTGEAHRNRSPRFSDRGLSVASSLPPPTRPRIARTDGSRAIVNRNEPRIQGVKRPDPEPICPRRQPASSKSVRFDTGLLRRTGQTKRTLAHYLHWRGAHFVFTVKASHPTVRTDLECFFQHRTRPDFREPLQLRHGRPESRAIRTTTRLNHHLAFPLVEPALRIERTVIHKASGGGRTAMVALPPARAILRAYDRMPGRDERRATPHLRSPQIERVR